SPVPYAGPVGLSTAARRSVRLPADQPLFGGGVLDHGHGVVLEVGAGTLAAVDGHGGRGGRLPVHPGGGDRDDRVRQQRQFVLLVLHERGLGEAVSGGGAQVQVGVVVALGLQVVEEVLGGLAGRCRRDRLAVQPVPQAGQAAGDADDGDRDGDLQQPG